MNRTLFTILISMIIIGCSDNAPINSPKREAQTSSTSEVQTKNKSASNVDDWIGLLTESASEGKAEAKLALAIIFNSQPPLKDPNQYFDLKKRTMNYATEAAESGDPSALYFLSNLYRPGKMVDSNPVKSVELLKKAADLGFADAENDYCSVLSSGWGTKEDRKTAIKYCQLSMAHGYPKEYSILPAVRKTTEFDRLDKFLEIGISDAQDLLITDLDKKGLMRLGLGYFVTPISEKTFNLFLNAAIAGQPEAQVIIANSYFRGFLVKKDKILAYAWALIAKESPKMINWKIELNGEYTSDMINQSEVLAKKWRPGNNLDRMGNTE